MTRLARVLPLFLLGLSLGACSDDSGADAAPVFDAGPDAAPVPTGNTAGDVYVGAAQFAAWEFADPVLVNIQGSHLSAGGGEYNPPDVQSDWSYLFLSPSESKSLTVMWYRSKWNFSRAALDPSSVRPITITDWIDSDEAVALMTAHGYTAPDPADSTYYVEGKLAMYSGASPDFAALSQPIWQFTKIHKVGATTTSETWWVIPYPEGTPPGTIICSGPDYQTLTCNVY